MNPYSRMIELMEQHGAALNGQDMALATVVSVSPPVIRIGEAAVGVNLYCNPALLVGQDPQAVATDETGLKQCLTGIYRALKMQPGDTILVQPVRGTGSGDAFFILGKVVGL